MIKHNSGDHPSNKVTSLTQKIKICKINQGDEIKDNYEFQKLLFNYF